MSNRFTATDEKWMKRAIQLADKGGGHVSPNPLVGCVIVSSEGREIGSGYHERYGSAHAEINALKQIEDRSELIDATVYVTLEPCSHHGQTPPCAEILAQLPLSRVVVAMQDPNPRVNGAGIQRLRQSGITVDAGLLEELVRRQNEAFIHFVRFGKPFVTLKWAQTLDGYIAAPDGDSRWISGERSRKKVHKWRSAYDAVMIGRNTAEQDNPRLTVRHVQGRQPYRIVIDGQMSLPRHLNVFSDQFEEKTIVVTHNRSGYDQTIGPMLERLQSDYFRGQVVPVSEFEGHSNLEQALHVLAGMKITSILVEAGQHLATAMIKQNLVDKLHVFISPRILGGGTRSVLGTGWHGMDDVAALNHVKWEKEGSDMLFTGYF